MFPSEARQVPASGRGQPAPVHVPRLPKPHAALGPAHRWRGSSSRARPSPAASRRAGASLRPRHASRARGLAVPGQSHGQPPFSRCCRAHRSPMLERRPGSFRRKRPDVCIWCGNIFLTQQVLSILRSRTGTLLGSSRRCRSARRPHSLAACRSRFHRSYPRSPPRERGHSSGRATPAVTGGALQR